MPTPNPRLHLKLLRLLTSNPQTCSQCARRLFATARRSLKPATTPNPTNTLESITSSAAARLGTPQNQPKARQIAPAKLSADFVPKPLGEPLGFPTAPRPEVDDRKPAKATTAAGRYAQRTERICKEWAKPYFRDLTNLSYHDGKIFLANERLWKAGAALWFPNIMGSTLERSLVSADTTTVLRGMISVVTIFSRKWAWNQVQTYVGEKHNPQVAEILRAYPKKTQLVQINFEEGRLFSGVQGLFKISLRRTERREDWHRYFLVGALGMELKEVLGMMNDKIGYIFIVDEQCKIRWAACADANEDEKRALCSGLRRLAEETLPTKKL